MLGENIMFRNLSIMTVVTLASMGAMASAEVVNMQPGEFTVFSGKRLKTNSDVTVQGGMASLTSDINLGSGVTIYGDIGLPRFFGPVVMREPLPCHSFRCLAA
jgi:hypothetical protein